MQIDDTNGRGWTLRWSLAAGFPACVEDALPKGDPAAPLAIAQNTAVRDLIALVEPYEAALALICAGNPSNGQPMHIDDPDNPGHFIPNPAYAELPRTITTTDADGNSATTPEPRWLAYDAATAIVNASSSTTAAHALVRTGEPAQSDDTHPAWIAACATLNAALASAAAANGAAQLPAMKDAKAALVAIERDQRVYGGFTVPVQVSAAMGGKVLQTRPSDARNWLTSQCAYMAAVSQGFGAVMGANFRDDDNKTTTVSYLEAMQILLAMAAWGAAIYARSWALKDAIAAAADLAALDAIDVEAGWP